MTRTRVRRRTPQAVRRHRTVAVLVGLLLLVPVAAKAASGMGPNGHELRVQRYVVRPGDTLWSIAQARGESDPRALVDAIGQENGDAAYMLTPGEILRIPLS